LINQDSRIGIENPGYADARNIFSLKSPRVVPLEVDEHGLIPGKDVNSCEFVYVTPSHQSPTTVTMPIERREHLLKDAETHDFLIIEDDYESEINFVREPTPALKSLDRGNRVIYPSPHESLHLVGPRSGCGGPGNSIPVSCKNAPARLAF
jgi:GntR family transcriptional regulator/MocR family aminotransferase